MPPSESALLVATVRPVEVRSDIEADGARPVTYTCSALPCAEKLAAPAAFAAPTGSANTNAIASAVRERILMHPSVVIPSGALPRHPRGASSEG